MGLHKPMSIDEHEFRELMTKTRPVLVCFSAEWSEPCRRIYDVLCKAADSFYGTIEVGVVELENAPLVAAERGIVSIPTTVLYCGNEEMERMVGVREYEDVEKMVLRYI